MKDYFIKSGDLSLPSQFQQPPNYMLLIVKKERLIVKTGEAL